MGRTTAALVIVMTLCAGCSSEPERAAAPAPTPSPATTTTATTPPATPPPTNAGPLSIEAFPTPEKLGRGWRYRVDPGDPEAGYAGNGTPGLERDPQEMAALAVPLGCPRAAAMPTAAHAFEVDYEFEGRPVVAVRLSFDKPRQAETFTAARRLNLRSCLGLSGGPAVGPYVGHVRGDLNDRTPKSEPWTELVLRRGTGVLLMAAQGTLEEQPFDVRRIRELLEGG